MSAQKELYEKYAVSFKRMALNYVRQKADADDVLQEGFIKILKNINQYNETGSFEGWMKRIIINTALKQYRKEKQSINQLSFDDIHETNILDIEDVVDHENVDIRDIDQSKVDYSLIERADFSKKELLEAIDTLKEDFKIVFNLYFHDDLKHQDIAEILGIDEKTSRSRLSRARKFVQEALYKKCIEKVTIK
ncbi:MAG: RNA polymerase sigma factor [Bacteroidales bacterium]|nr:RNA polymerase sigma factor [Bacteroidales bacterium]